MICYKSCFFPLVFENVRTKIIERECDMFWFLSFLYLLYFTGLIILFKKYFKKIDEDVESNMFWSFFSSLFYLPLENVNLRFYFTLFYFIIIIIFFGNWTFWRGPVIIISHTHSLSLSLSLWVSRSITTTSDHKTHTLCNPSNI